MMQREMYKTTNWTPASEVERADHSRSPGPWVVLTEAGGSLLVHPMHEGRLDPTFRSRWINSSQAQNGLPRVDQ